MGYPHPYFGHKILVFLRLQGGLRCKIVKTKEFPAKSSRIKSYGTFRRLQDGRRGENDVPGRFEGKLLRIIVRRNEVIICIKTVVSDQWSVIVSPISKSRCGPPSHGIRGIPGPQKRGTGATRLWLDHRGDGSHGKNKTHRLRKLNESMRRVELCCPFVDCVRDHHRGANLRGVLIGLLKSLSQQNGAEALTLKLPGDSEPPQQRGADHRITRDVFPRRFGNGSRSESAGAEGEITGDQAGHILGRQHKNRISFAAHILRGLGLQVEVEALDASVKSGPVMVPAERLENKKLAARAHQATTRSRAARKARRSRVFGLGG